MTVLLKGRRGGGNASNFSLEDREEKTHSAGMQFHLPYLRRPFGIAMESKRSLVDSILGNAEFFCLARRESFLERGLDSLVLPLFKKGEQRSPNGKNQRFPATLKAWVQAARPAFYIATLAPLLIGGIIAGKTYDAFQPGLFCVILLCCFFLHFAANLANDVFDHLQGVDAGGNIGGSRALQEGKISLTAYKRALIILYSGAMLLGAAGVWYTRLNGIWAIIAFAVFSSLFYVAPPIRYGHRALGEVFVFLNMGVVMTAGTTYTLSGVWDGRALAVSVPVGLMVAGILYYQSLPEIETDKAAGKHTLANVLGPERAVALFRLWWPLIWLCMLLLWLAGACAWPVPIGIVLCLPLYRKAVKQLRAVLKQHRLNQELIRLWEERAADTVAAVAQGSTPDPAGGDARAAGVDPTRTPSSDKTAELFCPIAGAGGSGPLPGEYEGRAAPHMECPSIWLPLDAHGHLVRKMYVCCGLALIFALLL